MSTSDFGAAVDAGLAPIQAAVTTNRTTLVTTVQTARNTLFADLTAGPEVATSPIPVVVATATASAPAPAAARAATAAVTAPARRGSAEPRHRRQPGGPRRGRSSRRGRNPDRHRGQGGRQRTQAGPGRRRVELSAPP